MWILAPGVLTGALLGWAEHPRRTGDRRGWRWLAAAPLLFAGVLVYGMITPPGGPMAGVEEFLADEVFTQGDLAVELIAHDVDHSSPPPERTSLAVLKDRVTVLRRAFPDLHLIVEDQIVEADRIVTRSTVRGTHTAEFLGVAPTGRQVAFELININRIGADGRLTEYWAAVDTHSLLQQLGALRAASAA